MILVFFPPFLLFFSIFYYFLPFHFPIISPPSHSFIILSLYSLFDRFSFPLFLVSFTAFIHPSIPPSLIHFFAPLFLQLIFLFSFSPPYLFILLLSFSLSSFTSFFSFPQYFFLFIIFAYHSFFFFLPSITFFLSLFAYFFGLLQSGNTHTLIDLSKCFNDVFYSLWFQCIYFLKVGNLWRCLKCFCSVFYRLNEGELIVLPFLIEEGRKNSKE